MLSFTIETELEADGRWIADIPQVPGAMAYGATKEEAVKKAVAIALSVRLSRGQHDSLRSLTR